MRKSAAVAEDGRRAVTVDARVLQAPARPGQPIGPALPGDERELRFVRKVQRPDGLLTWIGEIDTDLGPQSVVFTVGDGISFGRIPGKDGRADQVETNGSGTWWVPAGEAGRYVEPFGPDVVKPPLPDEASLRLRREQEGRAAKAGGEPVIDIVVVYTGNLVDLWGGDAIVQARIAQLEALSNQAYADSQANVRIRVVGRHMVDYALRNDNGDALDDITQPGSKPIKIEVDRLRAQYGADMVAMLRNFDRYRQSNCGVAWLLGYHGGAFDPTRAFSVSGDRGFGREACSEWTFTHELGHNMGATHDFDTEDGDYGAYTYSRGYRRTLEPERGFGTIMAYLDGPQARIGYLSNPRITACMGVPCGDAAQADNARGVGQSAPIISAFRPARNEALPGISVSDVRVDEGNSGFTPVTFLVQLTRPAPGPVEFGVFTSNGTAVANGDYTSLSLDGLVIPAGQTQRTVQVQVRGDSVVERNEHFALNLRDVEGAVVLDGQGVATIVSDESVPTLSVLDTQVPEGDSGTTDVVFTVTLSHPSTGLVGFEAQTHPYAADPFSASEGSDFPSVLVQSLSIPPGATSAQFTVPANGDTQPEEDERFYVVLSHVTGAMLGDDNAVAVLLDDDGGPTDQPRLSVGNAVVTEGHAGQARLRFPIQLSQPAAAPVSFDLRTVDRSAFAGSDYLHRQDAGVRLDPGETVLYYDVVVLGDVQVEANENLVVVASNVSGARPVRLRGFGTILNDDVPGGAQAARDDRFVLRENAGPTLLDVFANDDLAAALAGPGQLAIATPPTLGTATVETAGTSAPTDDRIRYVPPANTTGTTSLVYRYCVDGGTCHEATVRIHLRPFTDIGIEADAAAGFHDRAGEGLRALPSLRFAATPLVAPRVDILDTPADETPSNAWDNGREGSAFTRVEVPAAPAGRWRVLADLRAPGGATLDLIAGRDGNGDGQPALAEVACVSAMNAGVERCEIELDATGSPQHVWLMAHNRGTRLEQARLEVFLVPPGQGDGTLVATGPGQLAAGASFDLRLGWRDHGLLPGESRAGYVDVISAGVTTGSVPVRVDRINPINAALVLDSGQPQALRLLPGTAQDRIFIDVPAGASRLDVQTTSGQNVDLYLAPAPASSPAISPAPGRAQAVASAVGASGNEFLSVSGAGLVPGRWYVTPVNSDDVPASLTLTATVVGAAPIVRPGSYFNAARSGHGLFLYPAGDQWAGLWYTYLQDGSSTWYYLQGPAPGPTGVWQGALYRAAWNGNSNTLSAIGRGIVTPTGPDAFRFSYELDGETGSEPMAALGRGCPDLAGQPLDASSHWFDPARAGTGYSVQLFPDYEFYAAFVYDGQGVARFLTAEAGSFRGADATMPLEQLTGFCPLCERTGAPMRADIGTLRRRFNAGGLVQMQLDAIYTGGVPGTWTGNDSVQPLGGPGTTQGCPTP
ncbi:Calx-beta domain-containing protein [Arenimonas donghaensis]|nr:Calx-beta domain-containing protein [Arenimonas donghaensis]